MLRNLIIIAALAVTALGFGMMIYKHPLAFSGLGGSAMIETDHAGIPAPLFTFRTIDDKDYNVSDFRGKTVLVHFFASWCAPCVREFPDLISMLNNNPDNVVMIAVSSDNDGADLSVFLDRYAPALPKNIYIVRDDRDKLITQGLFGTYRLPETYILNPDLTVREKIVGAYEGWSDMDFAKQE